MLESELETQNINYQENFLKKKTNGNNIQEKFNSDNNTLTIYFKKWNKCQLCAIAVFIIIAGALCSFFEQLLYCIYAASFIIAIFFLMIMFSNRNILLIKEIEKNILIAKVYNNFGCRKKKKIFNFLNNIQFQIKEVPAQKEKYFRLFVFNNLSRYHRLISKKIILKLIH